MHLAKYTAKAVGGLLRHYGRRGGDFADMLEPNKKNKNIDWEKTEQNYNLITPRGADFVRERCSEVRCLKRADVNVMCDWVVTIPKKLLQEHPDLQREFFEKSFEYLAEKYGMENIISAVVHVDEKTPHLHFAWIPVVVDKKRGGYKVSAKELIPRDELSRIHKDMSEYLTQSLGVEVDLLTGGTIGDGLTVDQLKSQKMSELQQLQKECEDLAKAIQEENKILQDLTVQAVEAKELLDRLRGEHTEMLNRSFESMDITDRVYIRSR